jgi:hypothetical protein
MQTMKLNPERGIFLQLDCVAAVERRKRKGQCAPIAIGQMEFAQ